MDTTQILLAIIGLLGAGYAYQRYQRRKAEALTLNAESQAKSDKLDGKLEAVGSQLEANKKKEEEIQKDASKEEVLDFWKKNLKK